MYPRVPDSLIHPYIYDFVVNSIASVRTRMSHPRYLHYNTNYIPSSKIKQQLRLLILVRAMHIEHKNVHDVPAIVKLRYSCYVECLTFNSSCNSVLSFDFTYFTFCDHSLYIIHETILTGK